MSFPNGSLSVGCIQQIYNASACNQPVTVQVLEIKKMSPPPAAPGGPPSADRYRLILSDSVNYLPAMLTTQLNDMVNSGAIQTRGVIRLRDYLCNVVPESVSGALGATLGSPTDMSAVSAGGSNTAPVQQQQQQQPTMPSYGGSAPAFGGAPSGESLYKVDPATGQQIVAIKSLDPYLHKWAIKARCSVVSEVKNWKNDRSEGQLMSVTLLDDSGEIRATMFNKAVDKFQNLFQTGGVYIIYGGELKFANKKFTSVKHAYELTLREDSTVMPVEGDAIPHFHFDFVEIGNISETKKEDMVDIIGVVISAKPVSVINTKHGETSKRSILLGDLSKRTIELTLWGDHAIKFEELLTSQGAHFVMAAKGVRVSDFGGRTVSASRSTEFEINPDLPKTQQLIQWFNSLPDEGRSLPSLTSGGGDGGFAGGAANFTKDSEKTLSAIQAGQLGNGAVADTLYVPNVTVVNFKYREGATLWYKACSNAECKGKKVLEEGSNMRCPTCSGVNSWEYRWIANMTSFDHTDRAWLSGFGDVGNKLIGKTATEVQQLQENDELGFQRAFEDAKYKSYNMKLSVKVSMHNGNPQTKNTLQHLTPIDYVADSKRLLQRIEEL